MRVLNLLVTPAVVCAVLSLAVLFSRHHMLLDIGAHFRLQYVFLLVPALLVATISKRFVAAGVLLFVLVFHSYTVVASLLPRTVEKHDDSVVLDVVSSNLLLDNQNTSDFVKLIGELEPDIVALQEYTPQWHEVLSRELGAFPHRVTHPLPGGFGIALYSKYAIAAGGVSHLGNSGKASINVELSIEDRPLRLINVHPPPPSTRAFYEERNRLMEAVALTTQASNEAVVVVGDFNSTPWTGHFTDMESMSGLYSARRGIGIVASWPAGVFPLLIPIDHMLVSKSIEVNSLQSVSVNGSDHRAIAGKLQIYLP